MTENRDTAGVIAPTAADCAGGGADWRGAGLAAAGLCADGTVIFASTHHTRFIVHGGRRRARPLW